MHSVNAKLQKLTRVTLQNFKIVWTDEDDIWDYILVLVIILVMIA